MQQGTRSILYGDFMPVAEDILVHGVFSERASRREDLGVEDVVGFTSYATLDRLSNAAARRLLESLKVRRSSSRTGDRVDNVWTVVVDVEPGPVRMLYVDIEAGSFRLFFSRRGAWSSPAGGTARHRETRSCLRTRRLAVGRQQSQIHPTGI